MHYTVTDFFPNNYIHQTLQKAMLTKSSTENLSYCLTVYGTEKPLLLSCPGES